jgi:CubicO group peptidase (beta-lactamase class C family)
VAKQGFTADEPGLAIMIQTPGKLLFTKGYGLANLATKEPITPQTMFELASVSKTFTATAILLLQDRGLLSIHDDVRKYLPELPIYRADDPIRIHHLLSHTSGLPEYFDFKKVPKEHEAYRDNADFLPMFAKLKAEFPQQFKPGEKHVYTNSNYLLLALIIERVAKKPLSQFLHDEIFLPAGMTHTFVYQNPESVPATHAPGYSPTIGYEWQAKKNEWAPSWGLPPERHEKELVVGDGSVWTNLEDMAKWDLAVRARKFLKPETWKLAITPATTNKGKTFHYSLGWMTYYDDPTALFGYGHEGSWSGFTTSYYRYLTTDFTLVILSNRDDTDTDAIWEGVDKLLEK